MSSHKCNICNTQYKTEKTLATHMKKKHNDVKEQEKEPEVDSDTESDSGSELKFKNFAEEITVAKLIEKYTNLVYSIHVIEEQAIKTLKIINLVKKQIVHNNVDFIEKH